MPRAPKKCATTGCEERVRNRKHCVEHTVAWQGSTNRGAAQDPKLQQQVLREEPWCACGKPSTVAGHIVPHAYGGKYVRNNLKGQCEPCNLAQIVTDRHKYVGS